MLLYEYRDYSPSLHWPYRTATYMEVRAGYAMRFGWPRTIGGTIVYSYMNLSMGISWIGDGTSMILSPSMIWIRPGAFATIKPRHVMVVL